MKVHETQTGKGNTMELRYHNVNVRLSPHVRTTRQGWANDGQPFGWFCNHLNPSGWAIYELNEDERDWLTRAGVPIMENGRPVVFRAASEKGTGIVRFKFDTGYFAFINNAEYEETGDLKFEKLTCYREVLIDRDEIAAVGL